MEASFYSDCPTDSIRSDNKNISISKQSSDSPASESSDDLINFLECGTVESNSGVFENWKMCDISMFESSTPDFASLPINFGNPMPLRFYVDENSNILTQVGIYQNVHPDEMITCLDVQKQFSKIVYLYIILENCCEGNVKKYNNILGEFYSSIRAKKREVLLKCALVMDLYDFAPIMASSLLSLSNSLIEINIGRSREQDQSIVVSPDFDEAAEADGISDLLDFWIKDRMSTLRCLRIYEQTIITGELARLVSGCSSITHLTLSKISSSKSTFQFTNITSFEFDGQYLGIIDDEVRFAKNIKLIFPSVRVVCFRGTSYDPLINAFLRSRITVESGDTIQLYQPVTDLKKVQHQLSLIYPETDSHSLRAGDYPRTLGIYNPEFNTKIVLYRAGEIYNKVF